MKPLQETSRAQPGRARTARSRETLHLVRREASTAHAGTGKRIRRALNCSTLSFCVGGNLVKSMNWIPAWAGMTT